MQAKGSAWLAAYWVMSLGHIYVRVYTRFVCGPQGRHTCCLLSGVLEDRSVLNLGRGKHVISCLLNGVHGGQQCQLCMQIEAHDFTKERSSCSQGYRMLCCLLGGVLWGQVCFKCGLEEARAMRPILWCA